MSKIGYTVIRVQQQERMRVRDRESDGHTPADDAVSVFRDMTVAPQQGRKTILLWCMVLAYLLIFVLSIGVLLFSPQPRLTLSASQDDRVYVTWLLPGGIAWEQGVRAGDFVISPSDVLVTHSSSMIWKGEQIEVMTNTGSVVVRASDLQQRTVYTWPLLFVSPLFFILAIQIYLRARPRVIRTPTCVMLMSAAFALALAPAAIYEIPLAAGIEFVIVTLFAGFFLQFALALSMIRHSLRVMFPIMILPGVVSIMGILSLAYPLLYQTANELRLFTLTVYILAGTGCIFWWIFQTTSVMRRRGLLILGIGTTIATVPFVGLYIVPFIFGNAPILPAEVVILSLVVLPISFIYVVMRYHLISITFLQRWFIHGLTWLLLILLYTTLWIGVENSILRSVTLPQSISTGVFVLIITSTFIPLQKWVNRWINKQIFYDDYDYRVSLQELAHNLSITHELSSLMTQLPDQIQQLIHTEYVVLFINKQYAPHRVASTGNPPNELMTIINTQLMPDSSELQIITFLPNDQEVLVVPLRGQDITVGYMCLGPKLNSEPFREEDRALLMTLRGHIGAIIRNGQLFDDLRTKVITLDALNDRLQRIQEEERQRISADIHDEPLQTALQLQREIMQVEGDSQQHRCAIIGQTLIKQLRQVCMTMQPIVLTDLGLTAALDVLAEEQSEWSQVPIVLTVAEPITDITLSSEVELVLYRSAQEAVNNSLRHGSPRTVEISLAVRDDHIELMVADDGEGFVVPEQLSVLVEQKHLGLIGMRERVQRLGGQLVVQSNPGHGTVVQVQLPMSVLTP